MIVVLDNAAVEIVDEFFEKCKRITRAKFVKAVRDSFDEVRNNYYVIATIWGRSLEQRDHKGGSWFSELVEIALAERLNELTGGEFRPGNKGTAEPDVVCIFSEWYNIEIKVSSTQYEVPGHAYSKNTTTKFHNENREYWKN